MTAVLTLTLLALVTPHSPELQLSTFLAPPLTHHPVAIDWSTANNLWVAELHRGTTTQPKYSGTVALLEDTDTDGTYDQRHVFVENLPPITSILDWPPGLIIACAPDIIYAEDTDHDHRADIVQKLFVGFNASSPSTSINSLQADLDGWIYAANGLGGGRVMALPQSLDSAPPELLDLATTDFRFHPGLGLIEPAVGLSPFGLTRDGWSHWITVTSSGNLAQLPLQRHDLRRNPDATFPDPILPLLTNSGIPVRLPPQPHHKNPTDVTKPNWPGGATFHLAPKLGPIHPNDLLLALPYTQNLWHLALSRSNGLFIAQQQPAPLLNHPPPEPFTPVQIITGPDGAVYCVDPQFPPNHPPPHQGRILRLTDHNPHPIPAPVSHSNLIQHLTSHVATQRNQAHRYLLTHPDQLPDLSSIAIPPHETATPEIQAQALAILHELHFLTPEITDWLTRSTHPEIRSLATRLSRTFLQADHPPDTLLQLAQDPSPEVRLELALALGNSPSPKIAATWTSMLLHPQPTPLIQTALLSSATNQPLQLLKALLQATLNSPFSTNETHVAQTLTRSALRLNGPDEIARTLSPTPTPNALAALAQLLASTHPTQPHLHNSSPLLNWNRNKILNPDGPPELRCLQFAALGSQPAHLNSDIRTLLQACLNEPNAAVREAAAQSLCHIPSPLTATLLIQNWQRLRPHLRPIALNHLLQSESTLTLLLNALETGTIATSEISPANRPRLLQHPNPNIHQHASKLLPPPEPLPALQEFNSALLLPGHPNQGQTTFEALCKICHAPNPPLNPIGPNLATIGRRTPEELYLAVLTPNALVEPAYQSYFVETADGESLTGRILNDSSETLELLLVGGTTQTLPFSQIDSIRASNLSLMPQGLEAALTPQSLADLLAYLQSLQSPPPH